MSSIVWRFTMVSQILEVSYELRMSGGISREMGAAVLERSCLVQWHK